MLSSVFLAIECHIVPISLMGYIRARSGETLPFIHRFALGYSSEESNMIWSLLTILVTVNLQHARLGIDWKWQFRFPCIPFPINEGSVLIQMDPFSIFKYLAMIGINSQFFPPQTWSSYKGEEWYDMSNAYNIQSEYVPGFEFRVKEYVSRDLVRVVTIDVLRGLKMWKVCASHIFSL